MAIVRTIDLREPRPLRKRPAWNPATLPAGSSASGAGTASGAATASGVGAALDASAGTATGAATASGVGASLDAGTGTATGAAVVSGAGASLDSSAGTATGAATASGVGASLDAGAGTAAGAATASGVGSSSSTGSATGTATGVATASGVGASLDSSAGTATGAASATGAGASLGKAAGTATGAATASGVGASSTAGQATGTAAGQATASGVGAALDPASGAATGAATASGTGASLSAAAGNATGAATATGAGASTSPPSPGGFAAGPLMFPLAGQLGPLGCARRRRVVNPDSQLAPATRGLILWLDFSDASHLTLDGGGLIAAAADLSNSGNAATQADAGARPLRQSAAINGLAAAAITASGQYLTLASGLAVDDGGAIWCVGRTAAAGGAASWLALSGPGSSMFGLQGAWYVISDTNDFSNNFQWAAPAAPFMVSCARPDAATPYTIKATGADAYTGGAAESGASTYAYLLSRGVSGSSDVGALFGEILVYDVAQTDGEVAQNNAYLSTKWGVTP